MPLSPDQNHEKALRHSFTDGEATGAKGIHSLRAINPLQQPQGEQHTDQMGEQHLGVAEHGQHFQ